MTKSLDDRVRDSSAARFDYACGSAQRGAPFIVTSSSFTDSSMPQPQDPSANPPADTAICPHLGVEEDARTCLSYPSTWNLCHRSKPAKAIDLEQQRKLCLTSAHTECPALQAIAEG